MTNDDAQLIADINDVIKNNRDREITITEAPATAISWSDQTGWFVTGTVTEALIGQIVEIDIVSILVFREEAAVRRILSGLIDPPGLGPVDIPEPGSRKVVLPREIQQALFALQAKRDIEYGGGIDWEIVAGRAEVERIVAFLGVRGQVPLHRFAQFAPDVEALFHTHPGNKIAVASPQDLMVLLAEPQVIQIIIAEEDLLILQKTPKAVALRGTLINPNQLADMAAAIGIDPTAVLSGEAADAALGLSAPAQERSAIQLVDRYYREALGIEPQRIKRTSRRAVPLNIEVVRKQSRRRPA